EIYIDIDNLINLPSNFDDIKTSISNMIGNYLNTNEVNFKTSTNIDPNYYENNITAITMPFNPANMVWYGSRNNNNYTRFGTGDVYFNDPNSTNGTWEYNEYNFINGEEEHTTNTGTFVFNNNIYTITDNNETSSFEELKFGEILDNTDLTNLISSKFPDINFTAEDKGVMVYFKQLITKTQTHGDKIKDSDASQVAGYDIFYTSFDKYIADHTPNRYIMSHESNDSMGISFATGSTGTNGTLVEINTQGVILNNNAGDWNITNDVLYINPAISGYMYNAIIKLINGYLEYGEVKNAGEVEANIWFNDSARDKIAQYFSSLFTSTPPQSNFIPITQTILDGKTFYMQFDEQGIPTTYVSDINGTNHIWILNIYEQNTSTNAWEYKTTKTISYSIDSNGSIIVPPEDKFSLIDDNTTAWIVNCECDDSGDGVYDTNETHIWLTVKPDGFNPSTDQTSDFTDKFADNNFTTSDLNGMTLYNVFYEGDENKWLNIPFSFTDSNFTFKENNTTHTIDYNITTEGYITFIPPWDGEDISFIKIAGDRNATVLQLCWSDDLTNIASCTGDEEYFYLNEYDANATVTANNANTTIYMLQFSDIANFTIGVFDPVDEQKS
ncbi:MAG: hypothetical protein KAJ49_04390, partial [Arcobacteraceae bacterium]|nr:hypothetical protein [Arcobacteraceae bacterium]